MCMSQILHGYIYNHKKERIVKYLKLKFKRSLYFYLLNLVTLFQEISGK